MSAPVTVPVSATPGAAARLLAAFGPFLALLALMVLLRLAVGEAFWSGNNLRLIVTQTAIVAIAACGMTMIIVAGGIDLSVGSVMALSGVVGALTLKGGHDPLLAVAAALATGAAAGAVNGGIIAGFGMAPFIVTLGMLGVARGLAKGLAGSQTVNFSSSWLDKLMQPFPFPSDPLWFKALVVAPGVWLAGLLALGMSLLMGRGVFGRHCYAIGSNEAAARLCGIRVRGTKVAMYTLAGAFVGLAGLLETTKLHQGDPTTAAGRELDVIAAVVIGGASLSGGTGTIVGTIVGALIMGVLRNGSQQLGWETWVQEILIGVVIVLAVGIDRLRSRRAATG